MRRLVEALNACWLPHFPGRAPVTLDEFKRDIRERQVWCSSCMIAFDGAEPIGVLIGAKRPQATLVDRIAVRPDRMRQGHGRHMLESLGAKLEILGPPLLTVEIPESLAGGAAFFEACGYRPSLRLTDWVLDDAGRFPALHGDDATQDRFVVPQSVADLAANGLLVDRPESAWDRGMATLLGRADRLAGFGLATLERIEAFVLYSSLSPALAGATIEALVPTGRFDEPSLRRLIAAVLGAAGAPLSLSRLTDEEIPEEALRAWGFVPRAVTRRFVAGLA